ncbi:DUF2924 domain-containing protein [Brevundimonas basaltis]|uniref:DUF2924 domain-containing protein n=1 Tax=Brevundimonas basaltis TaxID=472166 RepID=A0A7W8HY63_9CAUL|nr:DUF2924 domain-containing protein [Brevundimonas basaltis]MBB5292076.1 hypothetical protein [Brevundimonas basaltis]
MTPVNDELESFLVRLETMPLMELRAEWRKRWGSPPHALRSSRLLRHLIAWRLQAAEYGDLTWDDRRRLKSASLPTLQTLKEGSRVAREYLGVIHEVVAERDGFRYRERQYRSLSAIAREITGVRWNGPRFFGLRTGAGHGAP